MPHDTVGKVTFFHDRKGYDFIETDDADDEVFFQMEDIGGPDLEEGQEVAFDIEQGDKGPRAVNLTRNPNRSVGSTQSSESSMSSATDTNVYDPRKDLDSSGSDTEIYDESAKDDLDRLC